jgi:predicted permease
LSPFFDLRLAARTLRRSPASAAIAAFALGLGIGLSTLVFSIVQGAMLRGLPLPQPEEIVSLERLVSNRGVMWPTVHDIAAWREGSRAFESIGAYATRLVNLSFASADDAPEQVRGAAVSHEVLELLGVRPVAGRLFTPEDDVEGAPPVVIIGWELWRRRFDGAASAIGSTIRTNGVESVIIGVLPEGFGFPESQRLWLPLREDARRYDWASAPSMQATGRLRDGVPIERAKAELDAIFARIALEHPDSHEGSTVRLRSFTEFGSQDRAMLYVMMAAVLAVLAIACVNVANLLIGRAIVRTREVGIRTALGASRWRVALPFLAESIVLALAGAAFGVVVALVGLRIFNGAIQLQDPPFWIRFVIDGQTMAFVAFACGLCALLAGVVPALQAARLSLTDTLRDESRGTSSFRLGRLSRWLVIGEIALSMGLLVAAGLLVRSVLHLDTLDVGVPADEVLTARVSLLGDRWSDTEAQLRFSSELLPRIAALPSARAAAFSSTLPGVGGGWSRLEIDGEPPTDGPSQIVAANPIVSTGYFELFEAPPVRGRDFAITDNAGAEPVTIVNEAFERRYFDERGALGRRIRIAAPDAQWLTVVGVVPDLLESGSQNERPEAYYRPLTQQPIRSLTMSVRAVGDPLMLVPQLRERVHALDPDLPLSNIATLRTMVKNASFRIGIFGGLFASFGAAALLLASVGLYGVMSFSVGQRRREMGVRMAIGARPADVLRLVLGQGLRQVAIGLGIGIVLAILLARAIAVSLFQVGSSDPLTFIAIIIILLGVALVACGLPALRATRIDPIEAFRTE